MRPRLAPFLSPTALSPAALSLAALACLLLAGHGTAAGPASYGTVLEGEALESEILERDVRYTIYLPPGYELGTRRYPVVYLVYLLHGAPSTPHHSDADWIQFGSIDQLVDAAITSNVLRPVILVTPNAGLSFYINNHDGSMRYEDMFTNELIPHIDRRYRTRTDARFRGIAGLSMGGFGAMTLAMRHPDAFAGCAALSPALRTDEELVTTADDVYADYYGPLFGPGLKGEDRLTDLWQAYSPLHLVQSLPADELTRTRWYIDIGDDDFLYRGTDRMHTLLRDREVPHEYRVRDGAHDWSYWRSGIIDALAFVERAFVN